MCEKVVVVFQHEIGQKRGGTQAEKKIYPSWLPCTLYRRNNIGHYLPSGSLTHIGLLLLHRLVGAITFLWIDIVVVLDAVLVKRGGYIGVGGGKKKDRNSFFFRLKQGAGAVVVSLNAVAADGLLTKSRDPTPVSCRRFFLF